MSEKLPLLMAGSMIFQTVQMGIVPLLIAQVLDTLGVGTVLIGFTLAISWVSVLVLGPFVPALLNHIGNAQSFTLAAALTMLGLVMIVISESRTALLVGAILVGAGLIIRWIAADTLVVMMSKSGQKGKMIGYHEALMGLGIALGPLAFVFFDLWSVFWLCLILCVAGLGLVTLSLRERDVKAGTDVNAKVTAGFNPLIIIGLSAAFVAGFIENAAVALFPLHYEAYGYDLSASAIFVSGFGLGGTLLQPSLGSFSDRFGVKAAQGLCVLTTIITCLLAALLPAPFWLVAGILFIMGGAVGGMNTLAVIEAGTVLQPAQIPSAMTAIALAYTLGSVIGPAVSGILLGTNIQTAMLLGFAGSAAVLGVWLKFHKPSTKST